MSTGPEHYREAERLIGQAFETLELTGVDAEAKTRAHDMMITRAQVHATLALAAATAQATRPKLVTSEAREWTEVLQP